MQGIQEHTSADAKPFISFVITYYNRPIPMLRRCVESILALSLKSEEREIIVVDDGSEYSALPDLQPYAEYITYLRKDNGGLSDARNAALNVAKGMYVQFVDDDDYLLSNAYNHCIEIAREQKPDVIVFGFTQKGVEQSQYEDALPISGATYMCNHNMRGGACMLLFRNEILHGLRFTKGIYCEDEEFIPQLLLQAKRVVETSAKAYFYFKNPDSIVNRIDAASIEKRLNDTFYVICSLANKCKTLAEQPQQALQRRICQLVMAYIYNVIMFTHSRGELTAAVQRLHENHLFPLPLHLYTWKYLGFALLSREAVGRYILLKLLPHTRYESND